MKLNCKLYPADLASRTTLLANSWGDHVNKQEDTDLYSERLSRVPTNQYVDNAAGSTSSIKDAELESVSRFLVSSKHLALASPVFKAAIQCGDTQSHVSRQESPVKVPLFYDDSDALLVLLRLIHGQFRQVPREVDLGTLTQITILVDKYELLETTYLLVDEWLSGVTNSIPSEINDNLRRWIFIADIFQEETISRRVKQVAGFRSEGSLKAAGLPIPRQILGMAFVIGMK